MSVPASIDGADGQHALRTIADLAPQRAARTFGQLVRWRFAGNRLARAGLAVIFLMVLLALLADVIAEHVTGYTPDEQDVAARFSPVGGNGHLLGTDDLGRDTATRLLYGARVSLGIAGLSIVVALLTGVVVGLVAGYVGGWIDDVLMRVVDVMLAVPTIFLLLLVASLWRMGPFLLAIVISAVSWVTLARLVRGEVLALSQRDYVQAAVVLGASQPRVMLRHILPNIAPVVIVWASLTLPSLMLAEASLSYLGLGIQPPEASLGNMLSNSQRVWSHSTAMVFLPGLALYLTVYAINLVGNGLRDALDPRLTE